jgi:hypothetical protein
MRRSFLLVVLIFWMTGCIGASAPGGRVCREGLCIMIAVPEPVRFGEPVVVKITVTSDQDIKNLGVSIYYDVDAVVDISRDLETGSRDIIVYKGGASWMTDIRAGEEITFVRSLALPRREGWFTIVANAVKPDSTRVVDSLTIHYAPATNLARHANRNALSDPDCRSDHSRTLPGCPRHNSLSTASRRALPVNQPITSHRYASARGLGKALPLEIICLAAFSNRIEQGTNDGVLPTHRTEWSARRSSARACAPACP